MKLIKDKFIKEFDEVLAPTYGRFPVVLEKGKGSTVYDTDGKKYVDFTAGIGVNSLGFSDKRWKKAVKRQLGKLQHTSNLYYNLPQKEVAEIVTRRTGMDSVFFANSGAEANEAAIKCARKYSFDKYGEGRGEVLTLVNSFHGRTLATLTATGQDVFHNYFFPFPSGFRYAAANDMAEVREKCSDGKVCAVIVEPVQGEGGVVPLDGAFVKELREFSEENDILMITDEVQTGVGRTGTLFAIEQFDVVPDIITTAKGIGAGLPIGLAIFGEKVSETLSAGTHGSTFGANPVVTAGAVEVLKRLTPDFLEEVKVKGNYIREKLLASGAVEKIDGMGMMLGLTVNGDSKEIAKRCAENGLLVLTAKTKIRLLPPLNIKKKDVDRGLEILIRTLKEFA